jgi:hypothetical protein
MKKSDDTERERLRWQGIAEATEDVERDLATLLRHELSHAFGCSLLIDSMHRLQLLKSKGHPKKGN